MSLSSLPCSLVTLPENPALEFFICFEGVHQGNPLGSPDVRKRYSLTATKHLAFLAQSRDLAHNEGEDSIAENSKQFNKDAAVVERRYCS